MGLRGRKLGRGALGDVDVIVGVPVRYGGHFPKFRAAQPQRILLFLTLGIGHENQCPVAPGIPDQGQADTRVARRAFHDQPARLQDAAALGVEHHVLGRPILDGTAGIEKLRLAQNRAAGQFRSLVKFDEGRIAHRIHESVANIHICFSQELPVLVAGGSA